MATSSPLPGGISGDPRLAAVERDAGVAVEPAVGEVDGADRVRRDAPLVVLDDDDPAVRQEPAARDELEGRRRRAGGVGRIEEHPAEARPAAGELAQGGLYVAADHARPRREAELAQVAVEGGQRAGVALHEGDAAGAARERLDAQGAGAGEEVEDGTLRRRAQDVEHRLAHLGAGGAGSGAAGCSQPPPAIQTSGQPHGGLLLPIAPQEINAAPRADEARHGRAAASPSRAVPGYSMNMIELTPSVEALIDLALEEDLGRGDVTSAAVLSGSETAEAELVARET